MPSCAELHAALRRLVAIASVLLAPLPSAADSHHPPAVARVERCGLTPAQFHDESDRWHYQGYRLARVIMGAVDGRDSISASWEARETLVPSELATADAAVARFMERHQATALSLALAKDGRLVLARAYGHADKARREPLAPRHRFRIASISKPITATGILLLRERNDLRLSDKAFGKEALLGMPKELYPGGPSVTGVTFEHLLTHAAGGWSGDFGPDPMFHHPGLDHAALIARVLREHPLQREPGFEHHYSNFGYCLLGRAIESASGRPYERFIKAEVLAPCGIHAMDIGGDTEADRKPDEVWYHGQGGEDPYAMKLARMDAHGGWIASAVDVVRFLVHVDQRPAPPDILRPESLSRMFKPSAPSSRYAMGWAVNDAPNRWHNGSLPGSQSIAVQTHDGYCWAALTNTRDPGIGPDLDQLMWEVRAALKTLPSFDLFR